MPFFHICDPIADKKAGTVPPRTHTPPSSLASPADSNVSNSSCPVPSVPWLTCRFESKDDLLRIIQKEWIHYEYHLFHQHPYLIWYFQMPARFQHGKKVFLVLQYCQALLFNFQLFIKLCMFTHLVFFQHWSFWAAVRSLTIICIKSSANANFIWQCSRL